MEFFGDRQIFRIYQYARRGKWQNRREWRHLRFRLDLIPDADVELQKNPDLLQVGRQTDADAAKCVLHSYEGRRNRIRIEDEAIRLDVLLTDQAKHSSDFIEGRLEKAKKIDVTSRSVNIRSPELE